MSGPGSSWQLRPLLALPLDIYILYIIYIYCIIIIIIYINIYIPGGEVDQVTPEQQHLQVGQLRAFSQAVQILPQVEHHQVESPETST